jgi:hypothetical protein
MPVPTQKELLDTYILQLMASDALQEELDTTSRWSLQIRVENPAVRVDGSAR